VVKGALGYFELIQDILDSQFVVTLGVDKLEGGIQDFVASGSMFFFFYNSSHASFFNKPTVGLLLEYIPFVVFESREKLMKRVKKGLRF
jgi:hypothetical protein